MAALCSTSEHCESEIREKLQRAAVSDADIERVVERLYDERFLDTARYCHAFALDRMRFAHWGRVKIQQALRLKKLPEPDIRQALDELPDAEYQHILQEVLAQKRRTLREEDEYILRGKLIRFAAGRGFTLDETIQALDEKDE
ncbi:MAG: RecX family transcriptional regulator [Bacteroidaceae bacterium]|nr:RecX family transcriptional regulator [Bacteroidaceae bacterium]